MELRELRKSRLGTLRQASERSGIPKSTLGGWGSGSRRLSPEAVTRLSRALGVAEVEVRRAAPKRMRVDFLVSVGLLTRAWLVARAERRGVSVGAVLDTMVAGEMRRLVDRR